MNSDRLDWIFDTDNEDSLEARYDKWAETYDADNQAWGWRGPDLAAAAVLRNRRPSGDHNLIVDAGCGTGGVGLALRRNGWTGRLVGLDLSQGLLDHAAKSGAYDGLVKCSLYDIPLRDGAADVIVSSGVFTHAHVSGEAFAELYRITTSGGIVSVTQRLDVADRFESHIDALVLAGAWTQLERSTPERLHPERDDAEQYIITWQVT